MPIENDIIKYFFGDRFFDNPAEKVYYVKVTVTELRGKLVPVRSAKVEISKKIIQPVGDRTQSEKTTIKRARLYTEQLLNFYDDENSRDIIIWQNRYYKIAGEMAREHNFYRYELEYMNEDYVEPPP